MLNDAYMYDGLHTPSSSTWRKILVFGLLAFATGAQAQEKGEGYPTKLIKLIVPYAAGGGTDVVARPIAQKLSEVLGQQVIVENRPGASAIIGTAAVAKAPPDGYTLLFTTSSPIVQNPFTFSKLPYDAKKDFAPVSQVSQVAVALIINPSVPANTLKDFVAYAKSKPKTLSFGSFGAGSSGHIAGEYFNKVAGIDLVHVPYKGTAPALQDLVGGQIPAIFSDVGTARAMLEAGRVKALAVVGAKRTQAMPDLPTFTELGFPAMEPLAGWFGVLAPAGTPKGIVDRLSAEIAKIVKSPEISARLIELGSDPTGTTPQEFMDIIKSDWARWEKVVREIGGIKLD